MDKQTTKQLDKQTKRQTSRLIGSWTHGYVNKQREGQQTRRKIDKQTTTKNTHEYITSVKYK